MYIYINIYKYINKYMYTHTITYMPPRGDGVGPLESWRKERRFFRSSPTFLLPSSAETRPCATCHPNQAEFYSDTYAYICICICICI